MADAVLIAAHGSRDESGISEFWEFAESWQRLRPDRLQAAGFLEFARPTIREACDDLVNRGAKRIAVVPAMLMAAGHVKNDVPSEIQEARERHPNIAFVMARPLDIHPGVLTLCHARYRATLAECTPVPDEKTLLLLVGRGTSDPDANANVARVARFLWESYRAGWASVAFAGLAEPNVDAALTVCRRMGFERIVVQPYFLFDGILVKRIRETAERHAELDATVEIVTVPHLRTDPLLVQAFEDRAHEAIHGSPNMNCDVCKYRVRLVGRESDLNAPQVGHHYGSRARDDHDHDSTRRPRGRTLHNVPDPIGHPWDERLLRRLQLSN